MLFMNIFEHTARRVAALTLDCPITDNFTIEKIHKISFAPDAAHLAEIYVSSWSRSKVYDVRASAIHPSGTVHHISVTFIVPRVDRDKTYQLTATKDRYVGVWRIVAVEEEPRREEISLLGGSALLPEAVPSARNPTGDWQVRDRKIFKLAYAAKPQVAVENVVKSKAQLLADFGRASARFNRVDYDPTTDTDPESVVTNYQTNLADAVEVLLRPAGALNWANTLDDEDDWNLSPETPFSMSSSAYFTESDVSSMANSLSSLAPSLTWGASTAGAGFSAPFTPSPIPGGTALGEDTDLVEIMGTLPVLAIAQDLPDLSTTLESPPALVDALEPLPSPLSSLDRVLSMTPPENAATIREATSPGAITIQEGGPRTPTTTPAPNSDPVALPETPRNTVLEAANLGLSPLELFRQTFPQGEATVTTEISVPTTTRRRRRHTEAMRGVRSDFRVAPTSPQEQTPPPVFGLPAGTTPREQPAQTTQEWQANQGRQAASHVLIESYDSRADTPASQHRQRTPTNSASLPVRITQQSISSTFSSTRPPALTDIFFSPPENAAQRDLHMSSATGMQRGNRAFLSRAELADKVNQKNVVGPPPRGKGGFWDPIEDSPPSGKNGDRGDDKL